MSEDLNQIYCRRSLDMNVRLSIFSYGHQDFKGNWNYAYDKKGQVGVLNRCVLGEVNFINKLFGIAA